MAAFDVAGDIAGEDLDEVEFVASGGSGTVYRAVQRSLGRVVALKVLHGIDLRDARTSREARVQAEMSWHANVITLYGTTTLSGGSIGLVMEFAPGGSLTDRIARTGPLDPDAALRLGRELSSALAAAHAAGIVHRDVKPSNVLFATDGSSRLADFGISGSVTRTLDEVEASVAYAAPELLEGDQPSPPNDVYALALTLLVAASGRHPFGEDAPVAALAARIQSERIRFSDHVADWPAGAVELMDRCLNLEPDERPTAAEVSEGLVQSMLPRIEVGSGGIRASRCVTVRSVTMLSDRLGAEDRVLDAVSFRIPAGAVTVLFGPANSGARVALEVLAGQHSVASGSISVAGADGSPTGGKPTRVAFVSCAPQVFSSLSVSSNLRYMARLGGCRRSQVGRRVEDAAERMLLREFMAVRALDLSDANIRRLHLAMGLVIDPQLMLLDATGLEADQALTDQFVEVLGELAARGVAVAVFTSDVDLACMVADRLVVMRSGRVVAEGPSAAITTAYSRREAAVRLDPLRGDGRSGTNPAGSAGQTRLVRIPLRDHATIQEVLSGMSPEAQSSAVSISLARGSLSKVLSDLTEDRVPGEQCHGGIR